MDWKLPVFLPYATEFQSNGFNIKNRGGRLLQAVLMSICEGWYFKNQNIETIKRWASNLLRVPNAVDSPSQRDILYICVVLPSCNWVNGSALSLRLALGYWRQTFSLRPIVLISSKKFTLASFYGEIVGNQHTITLRFDRFGVFSILVFFFFDLTPLNLLNFGARLSSPNQDDCSMIIVSIDISHN